MSTDRPFVHLHCHSHFSLLDGANRIPDLVKKTKEMGMNAAAITDHGNLYGAIEILHHLQSQRCEADYRLRSLHRPRSPYR